MPKKKKRLIDMPDEEVIKKLFPKKVVDKAKEVAHEKDNKGDKKVGKNDTT
jgi:hypothetical protein